MFYCGDKLSFMTIISLHTSESPEWQDMVAKKTCLPHIFRWYNDIRNKVGLFNVLKNPKAYF